MAANAPAPVQNTIVVQQAPSNGLGTSGFVISLIGFLTCGLLCPLGLLLSFFGLLKAPRGMAIAGTILGSLGSLWLFLFGLAIIFPSIQAASHAVTKMQEANREAKARLESASKPAVDIQESATEATNPTVISDATEATDDEAEENPVEPEQPVEIKSIGTVKLRQEPETSARDDDRDYRTWNDSTGKFSVEAKFIKRTMGKVTLEKRDGKRIELPVDRLSDDDQAYIKRLAR